MTKEDDVIDEASDAFLSALVDDDPVDLYENAPCGYLSTTAEGTIVKANETFFAWTGHRRDEVIGKRRFQELLPPGDRVFYETHYSPMLRMQGSVREIAVDLLLTDGSRLPVLVNAVIKAESAGGPELVRTVLFDARERRAYETELVAARDRAEASEAEAKALAETLRASFTPPVDLNVAGLAIGGAFRPAGGSQLSGDFYDVFATNRGTHAILLGDVCGKGPSAAVVTSQVRHSIRAEVLRSDSPSDVLRLAHEALMRDYPEQFCTALLVEVDVRKPGEARLTISVGGHQLPILVTQGALVRVGSPGSLLGMLPDPSLSDMTVAFRAGDTLVLYTDGVPEARRGKEFFGETRTEELIAELASEDAATIAGTLADAALSFQDGVPRDDIAVVAIQLAEQ